MSFVTQWQYKVKEGVKAQQEWRNQFKVDLARNYFEGKQQPSWVRDEEWITLNMIYSHLLAQLPSLYSIDPYFYVNLSRSYRIDENTIAQWEQKAKIRQSYLNYLKKELNLKYKARLCIQDAHFAYGVMKVHYIAKLKDNERAGQPLVDELGDPVLDADGNEQVYPDYIPIDGRYALTRVHPDNLILSPDCEPMEDTWPWVAERIKMTLFQARKDKRFSKKAINEIARKLADKTKEENPEDKTIEVFEVYDIQRNVTFTISCDTETPLIKSQPIPAGIENHPYAILRFTPRDTTGYPIPPMGQGVDPQREYNDLRSKVLTHRKRFNRKYEVNVNGLEDPDGELAKLEIGEDGTIIRKVSGEQLIRPIQDAPLDQQSYTELALLKNDMVELLGATDSARGVASADSATEAGILEKRLDVKEGDKQSIVIDWLQLIAKKLDQLVQQNIERDEAVKITGPEGEKWMLVRESDYEDIEGEYDYQIDVGGTTPKLPAVVRAQFIAFLNQVIIPMPAILTKPRLMEKFAKMFDIEDKALITDMVELGQLILSQQGAGVNNQGSQAGIPMANDTGAVMGMANGLLGGSPNAAV